VTLIFFWLDSKELAIKRVQNRVIEGGHNIPEDIIKRRYDTGINNLFEIYLDIFDLSFIYDNSKSNAELIFEHVFYSKPIIHNKIK